MAVVAEVMTREVETIAPEASVQEAARLMSELNVGALPVCDGDAQVGMVTDRDITLRATATGRAPRSTAVAEVMTEASTCCLETDSVDDVLKKMGDEQIRRPSGHRRQETSGRHRVPGRPCDAPARADRPGADRSVATAASHAALKSFRPITQESVNVPRVLRSGHRRVLCLCNRLRALRSCLP